MSDRQTFERANPSLVRDFAQWWEMWERHGIVTRDPVENNLAWPEVG